MTSHGIGQATPEIEYPPLRRSSDGILLAAIVVVVLVTIVGFAKPAWALRIALICVVLAAFAGAAWWVLALTSRTVGERRSIDTTRHDSESTVPDGPTRPRPLAVTELQHPLGLAGLSPQGLRYLQFVATEKLWANHRLNLAYGPHHQIIQTRVTPQLWQVLSGQNYYNQQLSLPHLLHEIENL